MEIHQTRRFRKQLEAMATAGKNERETTQRAQEIIARLQRDPMDVVAENKRTRHGEQRLRDCRKYDLSCGFRLVGLKRNRRLIFTCIGSHDDCQRWIENNREHQDEIESQLVPFISLCLLESGPASTKRGEPDSDEYEEGLMAKIDEQMLREIFAGLYQTGKAGIDESSE